MSATPMPDSESADIRAGDILFDCPHCGKNMAIEGAGAGLMVPCAGCGRKVQVPIPDQDTPEAPIAEPVVDADVEEEPPEQLIRELDTALDVSNRHVDELVAEKEALQERRAYLEQLRTAQSARMEQIAVELETMQEALDRASTLLAEARSDRPM